MLVKYTGKPGEGMSYDLPPRFFRQVIRPPRTLQYSPDLLAYDIAQFKKDTPKRVFGHCIGHFFDNEKKRAVVLDIGPVWLICRNTSYRAAPSFADSSFDDEPANILSREEGAAPCELISVNSVPPAACEDGAELTEMEIDKCQSEDSGSYVIPGQTLPWDKTAQKTGGQTLTDGGIQC